MINILNIRTEYPHWSQYSGINQYLKYMDKDRFSITERVVPMGTDLYKGPKVLGESLKRIVHTKGNTIYNVNDFKTELNIYKSCEYRKYNIIQYMDSEHGLGMLPGLLAKLTSSNKRPSLVAMFHQPLEILQKRLSPKIVKDIDAIVLMADEQRPFFKESFPDEQIYTVLHGINTEYFSTENRKFGGEKFKLLTVGTWLRNYDIILKIAEKINNQSDIEFHLVTKKPTENHLGNVVYHEGISDEALKNLYSECNALLLPLSNATANNALLEGMSNGMPIISSSIPGVLEYTAGCTDFLHEDNVDQYIESIINLKSSPELQKEFSNKSRNRALELSWSTVAKKYEKIYQQISYSK